jgi:membrane protease YdiL (CAAX protease family)
MDVDLTLQIPRPTRDASGNAIWQSSGAVDDVPSGSPAGLPMRVTPSGVPMRFRHVALFLLGSTVSGCFIAILTGVLAYGLTQSKFVAAAVGGLSLYATLLVGYHWTAKERDWIDLRTRFAPVGRTPLLIGALTAPALIAVMTVLGFILKAIGINLKDIPDPSILPHHWVQLPFALLLIVIVAPICEELIFRGLLLDWLRQKMSVWIAAVILSVLFSLLHDNHFATGAIGWLAFTDRFLMGLGASALMIRYHSLRPAVVMHATFNAIGVFTSFLDGT